MCPVLNLQVSKFLDSAGSRLDYRRYAETLFDVLFAGGILGEMSLSWMGKLSCSVLEIGIFLNW